MMRHHNADNQKNSLSVVTSTAAAPPSFSFSSSSSSLMQDPNFLGNSNHGEVEDGEETVEFIYSDIPLPKNRPSGARRVSATFGAARDGNGNGMMGGGGGGATAAAAGASHRASFSMSLQQRSSIRMSLRNVMQGGDCSVGGRRTSRYSTRDSLRSRQSMYRPSLLDNDTASITSNDLQSPDTMHMRHQSWYKDLLSQGMTSGDIADLLGEFDDDNGEGTKGSGGGNEYGHNLTERGAAADNEALLEQHSIMAHSEARRRLQERLKHDPWETQVKQKKNSGNSYEEEAKEHYQRQESESNDNKLLLPAVPQFHPSNSTPCAFLVRKPSKPTHLFSWNPQHYIDQHERKVTAPGGSDLMMGTPVDKSSSSISSSNRVLPTDGGAVSDPQPHVIVVKCLGCRQSLSVVYQATLVRCAMCATVSPASSSILC